MKVADESVYWSEKDIILTRVVRYCISFVPVVVFYSMCVLCRFWRWTVALTCFCPNWVTNCSRAFASGHGLCHAWCSARTLPQWQCQQCTTDGTSSGHLIHTTASTRLQIHMYADRFWSLLLLHTVVPLIYFPLATKKVMVDNTGFSKFQW